MISRRRSHVYLLLVVLPAVFLAGHFFFGEASSYPHVLPQGEECTIGVATGAVTADGRPLLWKTRDNPQKPNNEVYYNTAFSHRFITVVNANGQPDSESWMGVNEHGFAILNANVADLTSEKITRSNGELMRDALGECRSVKQFVALLDSTNKKRETHANFGVIDSTGAAFIFEASADTYWTFDASEAPQKFIVRSNFACNDTAGNGIEDESGYERFVRSTDIITELVSQGNLSGEGLFAHQMRDFSDYIQNEYDVPCFNCGEPDSMYGLIDTYWSICRNATVSAAAIQGVASGEHGPEPAFLSTLWVLLGNPTAGVATPYWPVGPAPAAADGPATAPLCDWARDIKTEIFHYDPNPHVVDSFRLLDGSGGGYWTEILPAEQAIFAGTADLLEAWRQEPPDWLTMLAVEDSLSKYALNVLRYLTPVQDEDFTDLTGPITLAPNHPNPFNSGTLITYEVSTPSRVQLAVYDLRGHRIRLLADRYQSAGIHTMNWRAEGIASGTYLIRLTVGDQHTSRKCVHVK